MGDTLLPQYHPMSLRCCGDCGTVSSLWRLDLRVKAVNDSLKILQMLIVEIRCVVDVSIKEAESDVGILELAHGASVGVDVVATLTPGFIVLKAGDGFRS